MRTKKGPDGEENGNEWEQKVGQGWWNNRKRGRGKRRRSCNDAYTTGFLGNDVQFNAFLMCPIKSFTSVELHIIDASYKNYLSTNKYTDYLFTLLILLSLFMINDSI